MPSAIRIGPISAVRVPYTSREKMSRPRLSVPSQWAPPGPIALSARLCVVGSCGARRGAASAATTTAPTNSETHPGDRPEPRAAPPAAARRPTGSERSREIPGPPQPRVEEEVRDVHDQVDDEDDDGRQHREPLDEGQIPVARRLDEQRPEPGQRERLLDEDRPGEGEREHEPGRS